MTSSSPDAPPTDRTLTVRSEQPAVALTIRNHSWRIVASGVQWVSVELPEGIYMVEAQLGRDTWTGHAKLRGGDEQVDVPYFHIKSAVPIDLSRRSHEYHNHALNTARDRTDVKVGSGARVLLMARNWSPSGTRTQSLPKLRLERWRGDSIADLGEHGQIDTNKDAFGTCSIEVNPGDYVLNVTTDQDQFSLTVTALDGWQTQVFVLQDFSAVEREVSSVEMRPVMTSTMAMIDQEGGDAKIYELLEAGQMALASERPGLGREVFDRIAMGKWRAPILGLIAAHLLLVARTQDSNARSGDTSILFDREDFETILRNTAHLIGDYHPDIVALRTQSEDFPLPEKVEITTPPIFWRSWEMLLKASRPGRPALVRDNLWRRVRGTSNFAPFFAWSRADALTSVRRPSVEKALIRELSATVETASEAPQTDVVTSRLPRRSSGSSGKPELSELASYAPEPQLHRIVGEAETVEQAIEALATYARLPYSAAQKLFERGAASELIVRLRK